MIQRPTPASASPFAGDTEERDCPLCSSGSTSEAFARADGARFLRCDGCTLTFASPVPTAEALKAFYATYYSDFRVLRPPSLESLREAARRRLCDPLTAFALQHMGTTPRSAADVGCGHGARLAFLRELGVNRVVGCELDALGRSTAQRQYGLDVRHGDATTLQGERFQLVLLSEVIEHVLDPISLLQQCARLLEPGGILAISTPNSASRFRAGTRWKGLSTDFDHIAIFSDQSLRSALFTCNLDVIEMLPCGLPSASSERTAAEVAHGRVARSVGRLTRLVRRATSSVSTRSSGLDPEWGYTLLCAARMPAGRSPGVEV